MANDTVTNQGGSTAGTGASEAPSASKGSGQLGGSNNPISRNMDGSGKGDKWSKGEEEYTQDQAEFRPGDREKGKFDDADKNALPTNAQELADNVSQSAQDVKQSAAKLANEAQANIKDAAHEAQQTLGNMTDEAKRNANALAAEQKEMAANRLHTFADTLRETGRSLQNEDEAMIGGYAESAAGQIDRFAGYLQRHDTGDLINEVRDMARRQPEIFIAGSLAAGFLLGRFLKSSQMLPGSSPNDPGQYRGDPRYYNDYRQRMGNPRMRNYGRGNYPYEEDRSSFGGGEMSHGEMSRGEVSRGEVNGGAYDRRVYGGESPYPDLQYRDAMRGDAPYREAEFRDEGYGQGARYGRHPDYAFDRTVAYTEQEDATNSTDRSTTGGNQSGTWPAESGNASNNSALNRANAEANKDAQAGKGYDATTKSGEMDKRDPASVRGSQST